MGYLYLVEFKDKPGVFKIGKTKNDNNSRFWQLSRHHGEVVHLRRWECQDRYAKAERACHAEFGTFRTKVTGDGGTEFFQGLGTFREAEQKIDVFVASFLANTPSKRCDPTESLDLNATYYEFLLKTSRGIYEEAHRAAFRKVPIDVVVAVQRLAVAVRRREVVSESISRKYETVIGNHFSKFGSDALRMAVYTGDGESVQYIVDKFKRHHPEIPAKVVEFHVLRKDAGKRLSDEAHKIQRAAEEVLRPYFTDGQFEERYAWRLYSVLKEYVSRATRK